ncbi:MAG: S46 family peptidase [Planctomycetota bacterium]
MPHSLPPLHSLLATALTACAASLSAQDNLELGKMWTFEDPPLAYLEQEYGFKPTSEWLDAVRLASLRFGAGCSASFVSPRGLILTNHHCVRDDIANNQGAKDWVDDGFVASALADEVRLNGLTVQQLVGIEDITEAVNAGIAKGDDDRAVRETRQANQDRLLAARESASPDQRHQVVELFAGAVFRLYSYKVWDDVRLVCSPHLQTAHFGGDPDNFTYPRYGIDFAFCRAYENGEPADTRAHYFRWSEEGAQAGQLVFVTGNPGSTERLLTKAQMEHLRDAEYPITRQMIDNRLGIMRGLAQRDPGLRKALNTSMLSYENAQKAYGGMHEALLDDDFMARKARAEEAFQAKIQADEGLRQRFGDLWNRIAKVAKARTALEPKLRLQTPGGSKRLAKAVALVRGIQAEDATEVDVARQMSVQMNVLETQFFVDHLVRAQRFLPADDPYISAIAPGGDTREAMMRITVRSRIDDAGFVSELIRGGRAAVEASEDPTIAIARELVRLVDLNQEEDEALAAREAVLGAELGAALFAAYGKTVSPDATSTLRFSDGVVQGYPYNGTLAPWRTTFFGLYARNAEFENQFPFDLPEVWLERQAAVDMRKAVDFVCTNDSTGGNSGSPMVNQNRELVGLLFDGNIESLGNQFLFRDDVPRSVCVHTQAITESLRVVYRASRVLKELASGPAAAPRDAGAPVRRSF